MRALAIDLSYTCTGWAYMDDGAVAPQLLECGSVGKPQDLIGFGGLSYPSSYVAAAQAMAELVAQVAAAHPSGAIAVEETNPGGSGHGSRYTNKILEWLHLSLILELRRLSLPTPTYISNNVWRAQLGLKMSKDDKRNNSLIRRARKVKGGAEGRKFAQVCADLGATETVLVDRKMLSVRHANRAFGLDLIKADNDVAEAVCLGHAFLLGARHCDGIK